jgi:hypothetical protein
VLSIELQGHAHTLRHAAQASFDRYLGDVLGEDLNDHLWRFEPVGSAWRRGPNTMTTLTTGWAGGLFTNVHRAQPFLRIVYHYTV